jgi:AcrR family transcriptional regulator
MTATPWGEAESLSSRKLPPGPGRDPAAVERHQRERLFGATVAVVAERGYDATRVEDIVVVAGVSRNSFYRHFSNKRDCFVATLEGITGFAIPTVSAAFEEAPGPWDRRLAAMLDVFAAAVVAQPATARVGWVEVYAGGPEAVAVIDRLDRSVEDIVCRALEDSPARAGMPREIVRAITGGVRNIVHTHVREERIDEIPALMPELFSWMQSYHTPPERLSRPRRVPPELTAPRSEPHDVRERILAAVVELVAERGYAETPITEIAARAAVSLTTFYANFGGKEEAFLAALADAQRRLFQATVAHAGTAPDWATAVSTGLCAFFAFLATDPMTARLGGVRVWATNDAGLDLRARGLSRFSVLLDEGFRQFPETNPVAPQAIGATLDALLYRSLDQGKTERLYEVAPLATFITLAPFLGTERACEVANAAPAAFTRVSPR